MEIKSLRLSCSKDELQQLLVKKVARKSIFLDIENPVLSLDDGMVRIACELNPAFSARTTANIEFAIGIKGGCAVIELMSVAAKVRPMGGLLGGDWMFDGDWTKGKIMGAIERAVNGRAGISCNGNKILIDFVELSMPKIKITGTLTMLKVEVSSIVMEIG